MIRSMQCPVQKQLPPSKWKGKRSLSSRLHIEPDWNRIENKPTFPRSSAPSSSFLPPLSFPLLSSFSSFLFFQAQLHSSSNDGGRRSYIRELRDFYWRREYGGSVWLHFASSEATCFLPLSFRPQEWEFTRSLNRGTEIPWTESDSY